MYDLFWIPSLLIKSQTLLIVTITKVILKDRGREEVPEFIVSNNLERKTKYVEDDTNEK